MREYRVSRAFTNLAGETQRSSERMFNQLGALKTKPISSITRADLDRIVDTLQPGAGYVFINRTKAFMSFAKLRDYISTNPTDGLKHPDLGTHAPWSDLDFKLFIDQAQSPQVRLAVMVGYYTGQRLSDVLKMTWADIDYRGHGRIHVVQKKTGEDLWLPLHSILKNALDQTPRRGTTIVAQNNGSPYSASVFREKFRRERERLNLPDGIKFHGIRKSMACRLSEAGASTRQIMAVGGWRTSKQVDHYTRGADQEKLAKEAMEKLK